VPILALGRFISGLSSGAAAVVVPLYVNEIAPPDAKGKLCVPNALPPQTHLTV
jgi:MFS family permease